jgi:hypothetical protein
MDAMIVQEILLVENIAVQKEFVRKKAILFVVKFL